MKKNSNCVCDQYVSLPVCPCFCLSVCDLVIYFFFIVSFQTWFFFGTSLFCRAVTAPPCHVDDLTWRSLLSNQPAIALSSQLISVFLCLVCLLSVSPIPDPSVCLSVCPACSVLPVGGVVPTELLWETVEGRGSCSDVLEKEKKQQHTNKKPKRVAHVMIWHDVPSCPPEGKTVSFFSSCIPTELWNHRRA